MLLLPIWVNEFMNYFLGFTWYPSLSTKDSRMLMAPIIMEEVQGFDFSLSRESLLGLDGFFKAFERSSIDINIYAMEYCT